MTTSTDYERAIERLFDDPWSVEAAEAALVVGDELEAAGDRTGARVVLTEAIARAADREARRPLEAELDKVLANERQLLGHAHDLRRFAKTLTFEWRAGMVYAAHVDLRYVTKPGINAREVLAPILSAPALSRCRRLTVRVRTPQHSVDVTDALRAGPTLALEELVIGPDAQARRMGPPGYQWGPRLRDGQAVELIKKLPRLWRLVHQDRVVPLPLFRSTDALLQIDAIEAATGADARRLVGGGLWAESDDVRGAALARIESELPLGAFANSVRALLRPRLLSDPTPVLESIARHGNQAQLLAPTVKRITGDATRYPTAARRAAGRALAAIALPSPARGL